MNKYVEFKIKSIYPILRKSEKIVADYILMNSHNVSKMTMRDMSEKVGVSQPTIMRMIKAVGFNGYKEFQRCLSNKTSIPNSIYEGCDIHPWNTSKEIVTKVINSSIKMFEETLKAIDIKSLEKSIEIISKAQTVSLYAVENSYAIALDLTNKLTYLGIKCIIYPDTFLQRVSASNLNKLDVAIGISLSGKSIDTIEALKNAHKSGAKTIAITNGINSLICKYADIILNTGNSNIEIYGNSIFSRTTQTAIVNMLYMGIILSDYEYYSKRLIKSENLISDKHYTNNI